jgi:uncharacterized RDD family membrane protein YckC
VTTLFVETSEGVQLRVEVAGAGSRFAATLLDVLIVFVSWLVLIFVIGLISAVDPTKASDFLAGLLIGGSTLLWLGYFALFHLRWNGQTPGKIALGIRVVSLDGQPARPMQILLRTILMPIDALPVIPAAIGWVLCVLTEKHQRLGDFVAGTMVVRLRTQLDVPEPWPNDTWTNLAQRSLSLSAGTAARLTPDDRAFLREIITRRDLPDEAKRPIFIETARYYAERLELGAFEDARYLIKELYLFAREHAANDASGAR